MANTYTQIHIQFVFAVRNRQSLIDEKWRAELYKYITGIVQHAGHKMLQINGMPDHIHILIGMRPSQSIADLMKHVKGDSSAWINQKGFIRTRFSWQEGYGAFSYAKSAVPNVIRYIKNQEVHHREKSFADEYEELLETFEIDYDKRFIFKAVE